MVTTTAPRGVLTRIIGHESDEPLAAALHELGHLGRVECLNVPTAELERRRFRVTSDQGQEYAIALPRGEQLVDGAVLALDERGAVVVRAGAPRMLRVRALTLPAAMRIGFLAGHLHWKSALRDDILEIRLEGPDSDYTDRIQTLLDEAAVEVIQADDE